MKFNLVELRDDCDVNKDYNGGDDDAIISVKALAFFGL